MGQGPFETEAYVLVIRTHHVFFYIIIYLYHATENTANQNRG